MTKSALKTVPGLLEYVGRTLFPGRGWLARLAEGLGMSRAQLYDYRHMTPKRFSRNRDIEAELIALIERERALSQGRSAALTVLLLEIERLTGVKRKPKEIDDVAA